MNRRRAEAVIGIVLMLLAGWLAFDDWNLNRQHNAQAEKLAREHAALEHQVDCNAKLLAVLRKRSDARILVDLGTMRAQDTLAALLNDLAESGGTGLRADDPHVIEARDAFMVAANTRANPDLWAPYPDC